MKTFKKIMKWTGLSVGTLLLLIVLTGLAFRMISPATHQPLGELVDIGDFKLHINSTGEKSNRPTLVIEGGSGTATEYYHWLSEGLKDSIRVVRYDRAGIGYSEASNTPRDPETIAHELHALLEKAGESPPYIMAGHSLGGPYVRVFAELYPEEVVGLFLLDATHPERAKRIASIPSESSWKFRSMIWMHDLQGLLADLGVMILYDRLMGPIEPREMEGLPDEINRRTIDFINGGKYIRAFGKEFAGYYSTLDRAGENIDFGDLPVRIFSGDSGDVPEEIYQQYLRKGIDLRKTKAEGRKMQKELLELSTDSKLTKINGNHNTMYTIEENAEVICEEVLLLIREMER